MTDYRITQTRQKASAQIFSVLLQGMKEQRVLSKARLMQELMVKFGLSIHGAEELVVFMSKNMYTIDGDIMTPVKGGDDE